MHKTVKLPSGEPVSRLGLGTWEMGVDKRRAQEEVRAIRTGLDLGMNLIDTAEMYGEGGAEEMLGEALNGRRDEVFLISKVYPHNAGRKAAIQACERSLKRLKMETIDLYLLHWRGTVPLHETVEAFESLVKAGKIRYWGVSNFDTSDMEELFSLPGGNEVQTNQVLYNLQQREMEWSLYPLCQKRRIPIMAYCPLGQGALAKNKVLQSIAKQHQATAAQIALAWLLRKEDIISIPKAVKLEHLQQNAQALEIQLSKEDILLLEQTFPGPKKPVTLEII
jgi:diketogulonate reductase-like aldo/keto reductase